MNPKTKAKKAKKPAAKIERLTPRQEALAALKACDTGDREHDHASADEALCDLLDALGYDDVVAEYRSIGKWYA
jgi:hypothetical protein